MLQAVRAVPGGKDFDRFRASFEALGAAVAFAFYGSFRAHFLSGSENVLHHRNLHSHLIQSSCRLPSSTSTNVVIKAGMGSKSAGVDGTKTAACLRTGGRADMSEPAVARRQWPESSCASESLCSFLVHWLHRVDHLGVKVTRFGRE